MTNHKSSNMKKPDKMRIRPRIEYEIKIGCDNIEGDSITKLEGV